MEDISLIKHDPWRSMVLYDTKMKKRQGLRRHVWLMLDSTKRQIETLDPEKSV
jgi:hypothetical protein